MAALCAKFIAPINNLCIWRSEPPHFLVDALVHDYITIEIFHFLFTYHRLVHF
jgi:hypothetical protein